MPIRMTLSTAEHESNSANCRRYPSGLQEGVFTEQYIHCDGTQLKLTDLDLGQGQYQIRDYYVWLAGSDKQLLFIFPTRVSLTIITLHYYSDSDQGLPRPRFYAVPNVWVQATQVYMLLQSHQVESQQVMGMLVPMSTSTQRNY